MICDQCGKNEATVITLKAGYFVATHPRGRSAIRHGPVLYCELCRALIVSPSRYKAVEGGAILTVSGTVSLTEPAGQALLQQRLTQELTE